MDTDLPKSILNDIEKVSKKYNLDEESKKRLIEKVKEVYTKSLIDVGEAIGIVAAQSLSEPTTQMILKSFHYVGMAEAQVSLGFPRIEEILNAKKKIEEKVMHIYLLDEYKENEDKAYEVAKKIVEKKLGDISNIGLDIDRNAILVILDEDRMNFYNIDKKEIYEIIKKRFKKYKVYEDDENTFVIEFKNKKPKELYKIKNSLKNLHIAGIKGITDIIVKKEEGEYVIYTYGSNLLEVMKIPEVDYTRVYTSDINEIEKVLGIEAAREAIVRELAKVYEKQGLAIDIRHILLIADSLTWYGAYLGVTRYGLLNEKASVLSKASFELPIHQFIMSAGFSIEDKVNSGIDNLMLNQIIPFGSGAFDIYYKGEEKNISNNKD